MTKFSMITRRIRFAGLLVGTAALVAGCDLSLSGGGDVDPVSNGQTLTYSYQVTTSSDYDADSVNLPICLTSNLPPQATLQNAVTDMGTCTGSDPVVCTLGDMPVSTTAHITITVTVNGTPGESISNYAFAAPCSCSDTSCTLVGGEDNSANNELTIDTFIACTDDSQCADDNPCTQNDVCDDGLCANRLEAPASCHIADKNLLLVKNDPDNSKDKFVWKWLKGNAPLGEFGNPVTTDAYKLCIVDANDHLIGYDPLLQIYPGSSNWTATPVGFKYKLDSPFSQARKLLLKSGTAGKGKIIATAKGANAYVVAPTGSPLALPVQAYLINLENGACWSSTFNSATKNDGRQFKAKTP